MTLGQVLYRPSPWSRVAPPGTPAGDERRDNFISQVMAVCGQIETLWLPKTTDTTTTTEASRNALVYTHDATIASRITSLGSGVSVSFNGTSGEADTPDVAALSFGNSVVDSPFSIIAWVNQTATTGVKAIYSKFDTAGTLREYQLVLDAAEKLRLRLYDESADTYIGRLYNTALGTGSTLMVASTYDGSASSAGIVLYSAGAIIDDTDDNSGTYVAMENSATVGRIFSSGSATAAEWFSGSGLCVVVCAKALSHEDIWTLKAAGNAFWDLTL